MDKFSKPYTTERAKLWFDRRRLLSRLNSIDLDPTERSTLRRKLEAVNAKLFGRSAENGG